MSDQSLDNGQQPVGAGASDYNALAFVIRQALGAVRTMTLVKVQAVRDSSDAPASDTGAVAPVGFVDVLPLVNLIDGIGTATEDVTVFGLPYFRLQGSKNAIIIDPQVGDIGLAVIADRDISSVKASKDQASPGSFRRFSLADGVYLGGILNEAPEQYLRFTADGLELHDKHGNDITTDQDGITVTDLNGNTIVTNATGIAATDFSGNSIVTTATGTTVTAPTSITLDTPTTIVTGGLVVDGIITGKVSGGSSTLTINSDVAMQKGLTVANAAVVTGEVTGAGIPLSTHHHTGVQPGVGNTGGPAA